MNVPIGTGICKDKDGFAYIEDGYSQPFPIPRVTYEIKGYKPSYDDLPIRNTQPKRMAHNNKSA